MYIHHTFLMQAMLVTGLSQTTLLSIQVGLSTTVPTYTDVLLPPPSRFCMKKSREVTQTESHIVQVNMP